MTKHPLLATLQAYGDFRDEDFEGFLTKFKLFTLRKGEHFYKAGDIPRYSPFIIKGCMRKYFINDAGEEQIVFFAEENWFAGEIHHMRNKTATNMNLQALEDCEILGITMEDADHAMRTYSGYLQFFTLKYAADHSRILAEATRMKNETPEQLYTWLLETRPTLLQRVPQHYIAAYLGIRTETISRIRKKLSLGD